jgi:hypothetical protein
MISTRDGADANESFFYLEVVTLKISERTYSHTNVHEYSNRYNLIHDAVMFCHCSVFQGYFII